MDEITTAAPVHHVRMGDDGQLIADIHCLACGYNLRSLHLNAACPECGRSIAESLNPNRLLFQDTGYLRQLRAGFMILAVARCLLVLIVLHPVMLIPIALLELLGSILVLEGHGPDESATLSRPQRMAALAALTLPLLLLGLLAGMAMGSIIAVLFAACGVIVCVVACLAGVVLEAGRIAGLISAPHLQRLGKALALSLFALTAFLLVAAPALWVAEFQVGSRYPLPDAFLQLLGMAVMGLLAGAAICGIIWLIASLVLFIQMALRLGDHLHAARS